MANTYDGWQPACDGSVLEVVSDHGEVRSASASAIHSNEIHVWTIHYIKDIPVTVEYRVTARGRILEGDHAGELSHIDRLIKIQTWQREKDSFPIAEDDLRKELDTILKLADEKAMKPTR
jgi:hypothetical protein